MKKYLVSNHSTKKITCIIIFCWVLELLIVSLTNRLPSTFCYTLACFHPQNRLKMKKIWALKVIKVV